MSDPMSDTMSTIHSVLDTISGFVERDQGEHPAVSESLDYLCAVIPHNHGARGALLALVDYRDVLIHLNGPDRFRHEHTRTLITRLHEALRIFEPIEVAELSQSRQIAALSGLLHDGWRDSGLGVSLVGGGTIGTANGAGDQEPTLVLFRDGQPVAQVNVGVLFEMASRPAPTVTS